MSSPSDRFFVKQQVPDEPTRKVEGTCREGRGQPEGESSEKFPGGGVSKFFHPWAFFLGEKVGFATDTSVREGWLINLILFLIDFHISHIRAWLPLQP